MCVCVCVRARARALSFFYKKNRHLPRKRTVGVVTCVHWPRYQRRSRQGREHVGIHCLPVSHVTLQALNAGSQLVRIESRMKQ